MLRERLPWLVGTIACLSLAVRLVRQPPVEDEDRDLATLVTRVQRELRHQYVDELTPDRLREMREAAAIGMLKVLDEHTVYVPPARAEAFNELLTGNYEGIGVTLHVDGRGRIEIGTPFVGGPAFAAGVEAGDVITAVDGQPVDGRDFGNFSGRVRGRPGTTVRLTLRGYDGATRDVTVVRRPINKPTVSGYAPNADGSWEWFVDPKDARVGYVRIDQFTEHTGDDVRDAVAQIVREGGRGVVLDVRFNGGGVLTEAERVADLFLDDGLIDRVVGHTRPETRTSAKPDDTLFRGPLAILVNGDSASASEILAAALADHGRAAVVGTRTFGKGSVQEYEPWGELGALKITVARWFPPSGTNVNRERDAKTWGVPPTIEVPLDDAQTEALARALQQGEPIPPRSHPTTRPARAPDVQLDAAVKTVVTQIGLGR